MNIQLHQTKKKISGKIVWKKDDWIKNSSALTKRLHLHVYGSVLQLLIFCYQIKSQNSKGPYKFTSKNLQPTLF